MVNRKTKKLRPVNLLHAFMLLLLPLTAHAQFTITAIPPPNNFVFEDLWHFTATGPQNSNFTQFYVSLRAFNDQNALLLKSNTATFQMPTGSIVVNKADLSPIQQITTLYYDMLYQDVVSSGGYFPAGNYVMHFTLHGRPTDGEFSELAEYDYSVAVEVLFPPQLISPPDEDTIDTPLPLLTWLPAYQASFGQQILYTLRLTEIYDGQSPYQSIVSNPAYYEEYGLPITMVNYPPTAGPILLDHRYAWQVAATINGTPVAYSQIWSFIYALPKTVEEPDTNMVYAKLTTEMNGNFFVVRNNLLHFVYHYNDYAVALGDSLRFDITAEETGKVVAKTGDNVYIGPYTIRFGENMYHFDLGPCGLNLPMEKYYMLQIYGPQRTNYYLRFYHEKGNGESRCK